MRTWPCAIQVCKPAREGGFRRIDRLFCTAFLASDFNRAKCPPNICKSDHDRSVVPASSRQVEDDPSLLDDLGAATTQQQGAASAADTSVNLSLELYRCKLILFIKEC